MCFKRLTRSKDLIFTKQNLGTYCMTIKSKMLLQTAMIIGLFLSFIATADLFEQSYFKHRLLLVDARQDLSIKLIKDSVEKSNKELIDRKLRVIAVHEDAIEYVFGIHSITTESELSSIQQRLRGRKIILIGLDGGIKAGYDHFDLKEIFKEIDGMPMRRAELRN